jgi:hypothetical protein
MRALPLIACTLGGCLLGLTSGCERLLAIQDPVPGSGRDGGVDADIDGGGLPAGSPILLSEVVVSPSEGEMIEIVNTSNQPVDLSTYYLSDSANYFHLPVQASVDTTDFIVKFPRGTTIGPHGVVTVAIDTPDNFASKYSMSPTFSVADTSMDRIIVNGMARLTDTGEPIILFQWDGQSDLVRDVDIMIVGKPSMGNLLVDKSGMAQDGSDPGGAATPYAKDVFTLDAMLTSPGTLLSTKRIALEEAGHELRNGNGNGPDGHDETSEDTTLTWDGPPFTAPTPGTVPAELLR